MRAPGTRPGLSCLQRTQNSLPPPRPKTTPLHARLLDETIEFLRFWVTANTPGPLPSHGRLSRSGGVYLLWQKQRCLDLQPPYPLSTRPYSAAYIDIYKITFL